MAGSSTTRTRWECRHQHRLSAALQARPLTTWPTSVLYTYTAGTRSCCTLQHATGFTTCSLTCITILNQTQDEESLQQRIAYPPQTIARQCIHHRGRYSTTDASYWLIAIFYCFLGCRLARTSLLSKSRVSENNLDRSGRVFLAPVGSEHRCVPVGFLVKVLGK